MFPDNVDSVLSRIDDADQVLDIGGWACPFNRADYVMDMQAYTTRGVYRRRGWSASQGGEVERFSAQSWIQRDICDRRPYPFGDKELDFVICSHTLEDVRDPLWVCSEMIRIAKRGYIEVPSRLVETCRQLHPRQVGAAHHRWLIDLYRGAIVFTMKPHSIHSARRFSFPDSFRRRLSYRERVQWLFWEDSFDYQERMLVDNAEIMDDLATFVQRVRPYPSWRLALENGSERFARLIDRILPRQPQS